MQSFMLIISLFLFMAPGIEAQDWVCVGGNPQRTNYSTDTTISPPLKVAWRYFTEGTGKGQPLVAEGKVFIRSLEGYINALDLNTGELVWRVFEAGFSNSWAAGMCYYAGRIYFNTNYGSFHTNVTKLIRLDAKTGQRGWEKPSGYIFSQFYSPIGFKGVLYGASFSSSNNGCVFWAKDTGTGNDLWTYPCPGMNGSFGGPAIDTANNVLFGSVCTTGQGRGYTFALDLATHDTLWVNRSNFIMDEEDDDGVVVYDRDTLYISFAISSPNCYMLSARTGALLTRFGPGDKSIAVDRTHIAVGCYGGTTTVFSRTGALLGTTATASPPVAGQRAAGGCNSPVIANGYIFRGGGASSYNQIGHRIYAASIDDMVNNRSTSMIRYYFQTGSNNCASPSVAYGKLFVYGSDGWLYCFGRN